MKLAGIDDGNVMPVADGIFCTQSRRELQLTNTQNGLCRSRQ